MATWDITTAAASLEFDTSSGLYNACYKIDDNHFINFWEGIYNDNYVQVFEVNTTTWAVTTAAASLMFDANSGVSNSCLNVDTNHFINFGVGSSANIGDVQVFEVNTTTWAVTTANDPLTFDTTSGISNASCKVDGNHFINFWRGADLHGFAQVFEVNTTTWAVTTANAWLEFDTTWGDQHSCFLIDENHIINFWRGADIHGFAQVFEVNTTTWAVTTAAASLEFDTRSCEYNSCYKIDDNHFINFWEGYGGDGYVQVFEVNTSTWAVTTAAASLEFDTQDASHNWCYQIDDNHFINFYLGGAPTTDGFTQVFEVNTSTWAVTTSVAPFLFDTDVGSHNACFEIETGYFINFWSGAGGEGYVQVFAVEVPAVEPPTGPSIVGWKTLLGGGQG